MASLANAVMGGAAAAQPQLPLHTIISGVFGSISMAAWLCVILPQMVINYRNKSAEALSVPFLIIWALGDVMNLLGGLMTSLAPTAVVLAMYFCAADVFLIAQTLYYNSVTRSLGAAIEPQEPVPEQAPLLQRSAEPGAKSSEVEPESPRPSTPSTTPLAYNLLALSAICCAGTLGWFISYKAGAWDVPDADPDPLSAQDASPLSERVGMLFGTISAICYLFARIPQIIKNYKEKSCEGLAILFFLLSLTGNLTYAISIVSFSQDPKYLANIVPWLVGSLGTITEDAIIFTQFQIYSRNRRGQPVTAA